MEIDTGIFNAITAERDELRSQVADAGEIRGHIASIAEAVESFGEAVLNRWQPSAPKVVKGDRARPARAEGGRLRLIK